MTACPVCHTENEDSATFCRSCKRYVGWKKGQAPTTATEAPAEAGGSAPMAAGSRSTRETTGTPPPGVRTPEAAPIDRAWVGTVGLATGSPDAVPAASRPTAPPLAPPPQRSIPTVVRAPDDTTEAAAVARAPFVHAVKPTDIPEDGPVHVPTLGTATVLREAPSPRSLVPPPPPPPPRTTSAGNLPVSPGEACPACARPVPDGARFCRCGSQLVAMTRPVTAPPEALPPLRWWQRVFRRPAERDFRRDWRRVAGTARARYDDVISWRAQVFRGVLILGAAGVSVAMLSQWGASVREGLYARVEPVLPISYDPLAVEARVDPPAEELPNFLGTYAVDGDLARAWATPWRERATEQLCRGTGGAASALVLDFAEVTRVDRIVVRAGLDEERLEGWARHARPRTLDLAFSDGTCRRIELLDQAGPQTHPVNIAEAGEVRITVADVHPAREGPGDLTSLAEVVFERR